MKRITSFFGEVKLELSKVTWPSRNQTIKLTVIVFAVSAIFGAFVGMLDFSFTKLLTQILIN